MPRRPREVLLGREGGAEDQVERELAERLWTVEGEMSCCGPEAGVGSVSLGHKGPSERV